MNCKAATNYETTATLFPKFIIPNVSQSLNRAEDDSIQRSQTTPLKNDHKCC